MYPNPLLIGERINVVTKVLRKAMEDRDKGPLQEMAVQQVESGSNMLDLNIGPVEDDPERMPWLIEIVHEVAKVPLSLDTTNPKAMDMGLASYKNTYGNALINSCSGETKRLDAFMPLAAKYKCNIIGLTLAGVGLPPDAETRVSIAVDIMTKASELGVPMENIYLDPLAMTVKGNQDQARFAVEAVKMFQTMNEPPMCSVVGLSNVVNMTPPPMKPLLTSVYWMILREAGLNGAIVDTMNEKFMAVVNGENIRKVFPADHVDKAIRMFKGEIMFADSFLEL
ncbi:MAG: dihydropteroate synthase [bacterium]